MGKFEGILLCTDLDDTLLSTDKSVSEENLDAIEYFKSEGGLFTFSTGRVPLGAMPVLDYIMPNAPAVCFNGGGIYDFSAGKILWSHPLDSGAAYAVKYIDEMFPAAGIEICTAETVYFSKVTELTERHKRLERFPSNYVAYDEVTDKWSKVIFMAHTDEMQKLKDTVASSPFADKYTFVQSSPWYYELLPKGISKGAGLIKLSELLKIDRSNVIAIGDNENDIEMIKAAGKGVAVANAIDAVKAAADYITEADNNNGAVAEVIKKALAGSTLIKQ